MSSTLLLGSYADGIVLTRMAISICRVCCGLELSGISKVL